MSEVNGIVERVVKEHIESLKRDKFVVLVGGKTYDCWSPRINDYLLKELPAGTTMTPATNEKYNPKLNLPEEQKQGFYSGKKSYSNNDPYTTAWDTILMQGVVMVSLQGQKNVESNDAQLKAFHNGWWQKYIKDMDAIKKP